MMTCFYLAGTIWQTILLVISQGTVIALAAGTVMLFMRKCKAIKTVTLGAAFLANVILYVLMQLNSRITGAEHGLHLHVPYVVLMAVILLSLVVCIRMLLSETKNRRTINQGSIKEAFDNLPTGVCFFNEPGLPVLCNRAMQRFSFAVCGKDVQFVTDLESCLADDFVPAAKAQKDGKVFVLDNGQAWQLEKRIFTDEGGKSYTQYVATDVTDLHKNRVELTGENERLRKVQADLKHLSANVVAVTREEEILNTKMRVHDEMGKCLLAAQQYLQEDVTQPLPDSVVASWQKAVSMLKHSNETEDEDMLLQVRKTCEFVKLQYIQKGQLPTNEHVAYLLTCAVRECVTNAVRYAEATALYVDFSETADTASVTIANNGKLPEGEIKEGGGLSTLRRRIEREGGSMVTQAKPGFRLTVTVPKDKEGIL